MKATYLGHSSVQITGADWNILFDPFITPNPLASHINVDELKPDLILVTHGHNDHVADVAKIQKQSGAQVLAIVETAAWVQRQGVDASKILEMNFGGTVTFPFGKVKMVYALHTNSTPDGQYGGLPVGFVLTLNEGKTIYFAGDTALTLEMQLLANLNLDWAFLPIGGHYTMDVADAIRAAEFINCKNVVGMHYDTFPPIKVDQAHAVAEFQKAGLNLHLQGIGESLVL